MKGESALRSSVKSAILFTKRYRNHQKISDIRTVGKIQLFFLAEALGLASGEALGLEDFAKSAFFAPGFAPSSAHHLN